MLGNAGGELEARKRSPEGEGESRKMHLILFCTFLSPCGSFTPLSGVGELHASLFPASQAAPHKGHLMKRSWGHNGLCFLYI